LTKHLQKQKLFLMYLNSSSIY